MDIMDRTLPIPDLDNSSKASISKIINEWSSDEESEEDPFAVSGSSDSSYKPNSDNESSSSKSNREEEDENNPIELDTDVVQELEHINTIKRRKIQEPELWKRNVRKRLRNSGLAYVGVSEKLVPAKKFNDSHCQCIRECHKLISLQQREKLFHDFWKLGNFDLQTAYLSSQIKVLNKAKNTSERKQFSRVYNLSNDLGVDLPVCKTLFKIVLAVSDGRLTRALKGKHAGSTPLQDKRGQHEPHNKTTSEKVQEVMNFISLFPKYQSHYSRKKNSNRMYLSPSLNISKMYNMYKDQSQNGEVSQRKFRNIFHTKFNLKFHAPVSDSCKKCNNLEQGIKFGVDKKVIEDLSVQREFHLRKSEAARTGMKDDSELAKVPENDVTTIAFDLMSTLPTPDISTGICYYKRQLWTYCLGVHNLSTNVAHMYMWNESTASRGPQEIGSCLLRYIRDNVHTSRLIMYSDQCGGQNRNIKMSALCDYILKYKINNLKLIDHKFLVSGHSYLACDRDFGVIEKHKKTVNEIYVPDDWVKIVKESRKKNPFVVIEMTSEDFISTVPLENNLTNRKKTTDKAPLSWLKMQWLRYNVDNPSVFFFKESNNPDVIFETINVKKRKASENNVLNENNKLPLLYPSGRKIDAKKLKDLKDLLPYIPPIRHEFYNNLEEAHDYNDHDEEDMEMRCFENDDLKDAAITFTEQPLKRKRERPSKNSSVKV